MSKIIIFSLMVLVLILAAAAVLISNKKLYDIPTFSTPKQNKFASGQGMLECSDCKKAAVSIRDKIFEADIADTAASRAQGLSGREGLAENQGMLFIFENPDIHGFWMKDMKFPLDIIWISGNRISGFSENLQPARQSLGVGGPEPQKNVFSLPIYYPPEPVDKVLEINAGAIKRYNFSKGDEVNISY